MEIDFMFLLSRPAKLDITHRHARGPGGQHVNKSNFVFNLFKYDLTKLFRFH